MNITQQKQAHGDKEIHWDKSWLTKIENHIKHSSIKADTPFMLIDLEKIRENCIEFKRLFPDIDLYYAIKALYATEIIESIVDLVDGFDVASLQEIKDLIELGVDPKRLAFGNPVKSNTAIEESYKLGVSNFAFQSMSELAKIKKYAPGSSVYVRIKIDDSHSEVPLSEKFGCNPDDAITLMKRASTFGLRPSGITFHVGSQLLESEDWGRAIQKANQMVSSMKSEGIDVDHINIGGGFPARYFKGDTPLKEVANFINPNINKKSSIRYVAEPGRAIVANSSVIVSKVIGVENRDNQNWAFVDVGLFQAFLGAMRYESFPYGPIPIMRPDGGKDSGDTKEFVLTGPSCDSQDIISRSVQLPKDLAIGDLLVFPNTGAYTVVYGGNFNGFLVPEKHFLSKENKQ